jgi:hypothetical protein
MTVTTGRKVFCVTCLIKKDGIMKRIWLCLVLVCIAFYGCTDRLQDMETCYTVKVTGSEKLKFNGHYSFAGAGGVSKPVSVEGVVPAEYRGKGVAAVCVFRKTTAEGMLKVEILSDGKTISASETEQPFGIVSLGKVPDTNSVISRILGMILK